MSEEMTVRTFIERFKKGDFESPDAHTQIEAGWYDWFCREKSLLNKTRKMGSIIKQVKDGGKVNLDTMYVWFKNNCPGGGPLYDDFRFADIVTGDVQFTIQINCCYSDHIYSVYGLTPDGKEHWDEPIIEFDSSRELVKWLNTPWEADQ